MKRKTKFRKLLEQAVGWFCVVVGVPGLFMPFLQGIILIAIGLIILSATYPKLKDWIEKQFKKGETRSPKLRGFIKKTENVYRKLAAIFEIKEETED